MFRLLAGLIFLAASAELGGNAHAADPPSREGDFVVRNFTFKSGETLATLRLHYTILGNPCFRRLRGERATTVNETYS